jgi:hypothetical protein
MLHPLKSNELSSSTPPLTPSTDAQVLEFRRPRDKERTPSRSSPQPREAGHDLVPLRGQVTEIINTILGETGPDEAEVRENLRRHVANHPGRPEKALLKHLLNLSS